MRIYVGGLWSSVSRKDLERLVREALRGPWYKAYHARGQLTDCQMLELIDRQSGQSEYCAVIEVAPNRVSWEVLQYLDGVEVHGRTLRAHRWFARKGMADRRARAIHEGEQPLAMARDRRAGAGNDRRRTLDVRPLGRELVTAVRGFQRSYGS